MRSLPVVAATLLATAVVSAAGIALDETGLEGLVWHAETLDGKVVAFRRADEPINPASLVKMATTLLALERLGPDHRFETHFELSGPLDAETGTVRGSLIVRGAGDPDFHWENAWLVAAELRTRGIQRFEGDVVVVPPFWFGWEGGAEREIVDADERAIAMGERLRVALDPPRWPKEAAETWVRSGRGGEKIAIPFAGRVRLDASARGTPLVAHVSKPLTAVLRRFNAYSNNDIERIGDLLGGPQALARGTSEKVGGSAVRLETTSGLGVNRMTSRQIVALLRALSTAAAQARTPVGELLPTAGCDPGTLAQFFPRLSTAPFAGSVTGKTGSLTLTDGGIAAFAGYAQTRQGTVLFSVAYPRAGRHMAEARRAEERFVVRLVESLGGPQPDACATGLPAADSDTRVVAEE